MPSLGLPVRLSVVGAVGSLGCRVAGLGGAGPGRAGCRACRVAELRVVGPAGPPPSGVRRPVDLKFVLLAEPDQVATGDLLEASQ